MYKYILILVLEKIWYVRIGSSVIFGGGGGLSNMMLDCLTMCIKTVVCRKAFDKQACGSQNHQWIRFRGCENYSCKTSDAIWR